jgi:hypothetical protein
MAWLIEPYLKVGRRTDKDAEDLAGVHRRGGTVAHREMPLEMKPFVDIEGAHGEGTPRDLTGQGHLTRAVEINRGSMRSSR